MNFISKKDDYRLIKHYWRDSSNAKIEHDFRIEQLKIDYLRTIFFGWLDMFRWLEIRVYTKWKTIMETVCYGADLHKQIKTFKTEEEAREYLNNLRQNIPMDEIIMNVWCWCGRKLKDINERCSHDGHTDPAGYCKICKWDSRQKTIVRLATEKDKTANAISLDNIKRGDALIIEQMTSNKK